LHGYMLGSSIGESEAVARKPREFLGGAQIEDRKIVRVSEDRQR
jgi:hypothetical protein